MYEAYQLLLALYSLTWSDPNLHVRIAVDISTCAVRIWATDTEAFVLASSVGDH